MCQSAVFLPGLQSEVVRSMQAKLLISDNTLSTHVRPRQRSDVPSKYSTAKRPRLP